MKKLLTIFVITSITWLLAGCTTETWYGDNVVHRNGATLEVTPRFPFFAQPCRTDAVILQNTGTNAINLDKWKLQGHQLPSRILAPGDQLTLWDRPGQNDNVNVYTGNYGNGWDKDAFFVTDPQGNNHTIGPDQCVPGE